LDQHLARIDAQSVQLEDELPAPRVVADDAEGSDTGAE
jgi:hypothetical protein